MITVLTGSTSGIGFETLKGLLDHSEVFILPVRNLEKAESKLAKFPNREKFKLYEFDLADLESVKAASQKINKDFPKIDLMINNAGGMFPGGKKNNKGLDMTFTVNHLGHFFLTHQLLPSLINGKAKVIQVSSEAHRLGKFRSNDIGLSSVSSTITAYGEAKLYNILMAKELTKRYEKEGITAFSLHPGAVKTAFGSETDPITKAIIRATQLFFISAQKGAENSLFLAKTNSHKLKNGGYYVRKKQKSTSSAGLSASNADELWEFSEKTLEKLGLI
ncbi:MAG: Dehydrogenase [Algoriphagus marincola HL-49]|uniref:Dehydrogenase n=1 Tax=Algoriphagus marincola HL-49 TaxID=1305737 RepID=A0A0N8KHJ4_9BACT|nr:MAG: Dehydrogenase [Algoriphagus marincola HL-49]